MRVVSRPEELGRQARGSASAKRRRRSVGPTSSWRSSCPAPSTSRCRSSATRTATWCICGSATARCSGVIRRWSKSRRASRSTRTSVMRICEAAARLCRSVGYRQRRHRRVPARCRSRRVLFHRSEPAHSGRAHGHRSRDRHRHRAVADSDRPGHAAARTARSALPTQDGDRDDAASPCSAASRPRTRRTTSFPTTAGSPRIARPAASASASTAATAFAGAVITPFYDSLLVKVTAMGRHVRRCRSAHGPVRCRNSEFAA